LKKWGTHFATCLCMVIGLGIPNAGSSRFLVPSGSHGAAAIGGQTAVSIPSNSRDGLFSSCRLGDHGCRKCEVVQQSEAYIRPKLFGPRHVVQLPTYAHGQISLVPVLSYNQRSSCLVASGTILAGRRETTGVDQWTEILVREVDTMEKTICWAGSGLALKCQDHKSAQLCPGRRWSVCELNYLENLEVSVIYTSEIQ